MQRSRLTRREALGKGLRLLAVAGPSVLLASACAQQPAAPAKPAESKPAAPAAATTAPAVKTEAKPAETKPAAPAAAAKPAETKPAAGKPAASAAADIPAMTKPGETPKRGGTLKAAVQNDFVTMWPMITTGPTASVCYDSLIKWRMGADGRWGPQPGLAESWELSEQRRRLQDPQGRQVP